MNKEYMKYILYLRICKGGYVFNVLDIYLNAEIYLVFSCSM